jgi:hypothetical protein
MGLPDPASGCGAMALERGMLAANRDDMQALGKGAIPYALHLRLRIDWPRRAL